MGCALISHELPISAKPVNAGDTSAVMRLKALAAGDERVGTIVYRLATANAPLCDNNGTATGLQLHAPPLYTAAYRAALESRDGPGTTGDGDIAVNVVIPNSPADRAGMTAGSWLIAIDGEAVAAMGDAPLSRLTAARNRLIGGPVVERQLVVRRAGISEAVTLAPVRACAVSVEIITSPNRNAQSVGEEINISAGLVNLLQDDESLAALLAHELAHLVLKHRERLDAAGVSSQLLRSLGRNRRLIRACELEADRLSVTLLAHAGFDPHAAIELWRRHGAEMNAGLFRDGTHPSWQMRLRSISEALAQHGDIVEPIAPKGDCPAYVTAMPAAGG